MVSEKITMSSLCKEILEKISTRLTSRFRDVERSKILLKLSLGYSNERVNAALGVSSAKVKRLRMRWLIFEPILSKIEANGSCNAVRQELRQKLMEVLEDSARPGAPCTISSHQYCQILGVSLEDPSQSGLPITEWSLSELKREVEKRGIVKSISRSQLGNFLKSVRC